MKIANKKSPAPSKAHGDFGEQLSFFPPPELSVVLPTYKSRNGQALLHLSIGAITQEEWLEIGRGWRLAATINALKQMGWPIASDWVNPTSRSNPIKRYYLPAQAMQTALAWAAHQQNSSNYAMGPAPC